MKRLFLLLIRAYQRFVSPALPRRCRYEPTCSAYAAQAVRKLGPLRGGIVAAWRLLRCNPLSDGGFDPLEERRLFRAVRRGKRGERLMDGWWARSEAFGGAKRRTPSGSTNHPNHGHSA